MIQQEFSFTEFGFSSQLIRDLVDNNTTIDPFIETPFSYQALSEQCEKKVFSSEQREVLVQQLNKQNNSVSLSEVSQKNINAIQNENAFTITTGHQLNLMTGPLYSLYKVAQIISITKEMNKREENRQFIPVFWMATEDHDFEEINHIHLFGNRIAWDKEGQESKIVGEIKPEGITSFTSQIAEKYQDETLAEILKSFTDVYAESNDLASATRIIMNKLFGEYGLVIIDGNDKELKKSFREIATKEIKESFVMSSVNDVNQRLVAAGYHNQVYVRECNLFHINENGTRERIIRKGNEYEYGTNVVSQGALLDELNAFPERFSPNALLRPVYQELILPNISYIGGGGEIAYWLQLKSVFDSVNLIFPLLRVRDSIIVLKNKELNELEILETSIVSLKRNIDDLIKEIALDDVEIEIELKEELADLDAIKNKLLVKASQVNKGLEGMIGAEFAKMEKSIERIESKLIKAEKAKHEQKANKLRRLQGKIYPNGGFQERYENFIPYFLSDSNFVSKIIDVLETADEPKIRVLEI